MVTGTVRDTGGAAWPFGILVHNFSTSFFSVLELLYLEEISFINLSPTFSEPFNEQLVWKMGPPEWSEPFNKQLVWKMGSPESLKPFNKQLVWKMGSSEWSCPFKKK